MAALNQLVATGGSLPRVGRVDLAAMVLRRSRLAGENIQFSKS